MIQGQWVQRDGEVWWVAPGEWIRDDDVDLWLVGHGVASPGHYAWVWLVHSTGLEEPPAADVQRWFAWFQRQGIKWIASGVLILRRRSGSNLRRAVFAARRPGGECGAQIERIFRAQDRLKVPGSALELWDAVFRPAPEVRIQEADSAGRGTALVTGTPNIGWSIEVFAETTALLYALDGSRTLAGAAGRGRTTRGDHL